MKFYTLVLNVTLLIILSAVSSESIKSVQKITIEKKRVEKILNATKFVSKSFCNTCEGFGFHSFEEWQKNCKALFGLEYIGWANASSFMNVSNGEINESENTECILFYGTWKDSDFKGEVFCKVN